MRRCLLQLVCCTGRFPCPYPGIPCITAPSWGTRGSLPEARGGAGATIAAAPALAGNMLAPNLTLSLGFLLIGFALSEMWRAPAAVMIRDVSPPSLGSTGSAVHLCVRNLIGGLGPLGALPGLPACPGQ